MRVLRYPSTAAGPEPKTERFVSTSRLSRPVLPFSVMQGLGSAVELNRSVISIPSDNRRPLSRLSATRGGAHTESRVHRVTCLPPRPQHATRSTVRKIGARIRHTLPETDGPSADPQPRGEHLRMEPRFASCEFSTRRGMTPRPFVVGRPRQRSWRRDKARTPRRAGRNGR